MAARSLGQASCEGSAPVLTVLHSPAQGRDWPSVISGRQIDAALIVAEGIGTGQAGRS